MGKLNNLPEGSLDDVNWPNGIQYLTDKGRKQCKQKGYKFAKQLVNEFKLFKSQINPDKVSIMSTDKNRVHESAIIFVKAMYKNKYTNNYQSINDS